MPQEVLSVQEVISAKQAAVQFLRIKPQLATNERRILLARALTKYHQEPDPAKRDIAPLRAIAAEMAIPDWTILTKTSSPVGEHIAKSSSALAEFLSSYANALERKCTIERLGIKPETKGTVSLRGEEAKATVTNVRNDYNLVIKLQSGRILVCSPGQFKPE